MKNRLLVIFIIITFILTGCSVESNKNVPTDSKTLVWVVNDTTINEEAINGVLSKKGKDYRIKVKATEGSGEDYKNIEEKIGKKYVGNIEKMIKDKEQVDIISMGSFGVMDEVFNIDRFIKKGLLMEIEEKDITDYPMEYNGKLYGLGNIQTPFPVGYFYEDSFLKKHNIEKEDLKPSIWDNEEIIEKAFQIDKRPIVENDFSFFGDNPQWNLDLEGIIVDPITLEVDNFLESDLFKEDLNKKLEWKEKGYLITRDVISNSSGIGAPIKTVTLRDLSRDKDSYQMNYQGNIIKGEFIPEFVQYRPINYHCIENGIYSKTKFKEESLDFLKLLYEDKDMATAVYNGKEEIDETGITNYLNMFYINENIIDSDGFTAEEKQEMIEEYNNIYGDSKLNGFYLNPKSIEKELDDIELIIFPNRPSMEYSEEMEKLIAVTNDSLNVVEQLNNKLKDGGINNIIKEVRRQIEEIK